MRHRAAFWVVLAALVLIAALGFVVGLLPAQVVRGDLILIAPDRSLHPINVLYVHTGALVASACAALLAVFFASPRTRLASRLVPALVQIVGTIAQLPRRVSSFLSETPVVLSVALAIVVGLGSMLRLDLARTLPIGADESITYVVFASRTVLDILSDYQIPNNHVFHTLLVHLSTGLFGPTTLALRLPAIVAGCLCIPASFWLARRLFDADTGLLAAAIIAAAPPMIEFSVQARGYSLLTLYFLIAFTMATYLNERSNVSAWVGLVIALTLSLFTLPIGLYGGVVIGAWLLLNSPKWGRRLLLRRLLLSSIAVAVLTALLYAPILVTSGLAPFYHNSNTTALPLRDLSAGWGEQIKAVNAQWTPPGGLLAGAISLVGLIAGLLQQPSKRRVVRNLLASLLMGVAPVILLQRLMPRPRFFVFLVPIVVICVGYGYRATILEWVERRAGQAHAVWGVTAVALALAWGLAVLRADMNRVGPAIANVEAVIRDFGPQLGPNDALVARRFSDLVYPGRYYLMVGGRSPRQLHSYTPWRTASQLDPYRRAFFVTRDCEDQLPELGAPEGAFREDFQPLRVVGRYGSLCVVALERKADRPLRASPYPDDPWGFEKLW